MKTIIILAIIITHTTNICISQNWIKKADMPSGRGFSHAVLFKNNIYVLGGDTKGSVELYNLENDNWTKKKDTSILAKIYGAGIINEKIYAVTAKGNYISGEVSVLKYYETDDKWEIISTVPTFRADAIVAFSKDKIFVIDGFIEITNAPVGSIPAKNLSVVEAYDPVSNTWKSDLAAPITKRHAASAVVSDSLIFIINGVDDHFSSLYKFKNTEVYNIETNTWSSLSPPNISSAYCNALFFEDRIYLISSNGIEQYDIKNNTWKAIAKPPVNYNNFSSGINNSKLIIFGGAIESTPGQWIGQKSVYELDLRSLTDINDYKHISDDKVIASNNSDKTIFLNIDVEKVRNSELLLFNLNGQIIWQQSLFNKNIIKLPSVNKGIYIIKLIIGKGSYSKKIILI